MALEALDIESLVLFLFILALISLIFFNPSSAKCSLVLINSATSQKSAKSKALTPSIGYFFKNGIIFSYISEKFETIKSPALEFKSSPF